MTRTLLEQLAATVRPHAERGFWFLGQHHETSEALVDEMYAQLHCRMPSDARARDRRGSYFADARDYSRMLSAANAGSGSWQHGWVVSGVDADHVVAARHGVAFRVPRAETRADIATLRAGDQIQVRIPREYRQLVPGFYMANGDADDDMDDAPTVRVYWNVDARGAIALTRELTRALNDLQVPFRFKTHTDPRNFGRTDSGVLYLRRERYEIVRAALARVTTSIRVHLDDDISAFTKPLAPGVGFAEDPGGNASFGQHRSRLLVEVLTEQSSMSTASVTARIDALGKSLRARGYDPDALFLNPRSPDAYSPFDG